MNTAQDGRSRTPPRQARPAPRNFQVVVDCTDPDRMAAFWAAALGYLPDPPPDGYPSWMDYQVGSGFPESERVSFAAVREPGGTGRLCFLAVPEHKRTKNRLHLDIRATLPDEPPDTKVAHVDALVTHLRTLGASTLRAGHERGHYFVTMSDVEGNEFCVH